MDMGNDKGCEHWTREAKWGELTYENEKWGYLVTECPIGL